MYVIRGSITSIRITKDVHVSKLLSRNLMTWLDCVSGTQPKNTAKKRKLSVKPACLNLSTT